MIYHDMMFFFAIQQVVPLRLQASHLSLGHPHVLGTHCWTIGVGQRDLRLRMTKVCTGPCCDPRSPTCLPGLMTNIGRMVKLLHSTNVIQCYPPFLKLMIAYLIERQTDLTG